MRLERFFAATSRSGEPRARWWLASLALHGLIYLALIFFVARSAGNSHGGADRAGASQSPSLSRSQKQRADFARRAQTAQARSDVEALSQINQQLKTLGAARQSEYQKMAAQFRPRAPQIAGRALRQAEQSAKQALQAQREIHRKPNAAQPEMQRAQKAAQRAAIAAAEAQTKAANALSFAGKPFQKTAQAAADAQAKHERAAQLQQQAQESNKKSANEKSTSEHTSSSSAALQKQARQAEEQAARAMQRAMQQFSDAIKNRAAQSPNAPQRGSTPAESTPDAEKAPGKSAAERAANVSSALQSSSLEDKNLAQLLDAAAQTEQEIGNSFQRARAAQWATLQKIPLDRALVAIPQPQTPQPQSQRDLLNRAPQNAAEWQNQQQQITAAQNQIRAALERSQNLLRQAQQSSNDARGTTVGTNQEDSSSRTNQSKSQQNTENKKSEKAASQKATTNSAGKNSARDEKGSGLSKQSGNGNFADGNGNQTSGNAKSGNAGKAKSASGKNNSAKNNVQKTTKKSIAGKTGSSANSDRLARYRFGRGVAGDAPIPDAFLNRPIWSDAAPPPLMAAMQMARAIPGRKIISGAPAADWMFVDSWYTIGPFPNPNRSNISTEFAPEKRVDLDAIYIGKDNRPLRWQFVQAATPFVVPANAQEYAVYYAYTELWFEDAHDLWIAVGSDDAGKLWIENQLVWQSSDLLKPWRAAEAMRRVHFKKGRNRVLYRVENGIILVGMSLMIRLRP